MNHIKLLTLICYERERRQEDYGLMNKEKVIGTVLVMLSAISFGMIPLIANLAYDQGISIKTLLFLRFGIGSLLLWAYILIRKISFKTSKSHFVHIVLISFLGYTITATSFFNAFKYISSSLATIIFYCYPVIVVVYEMIKSKRADFKKIFCLLIIMIGLMLVVGIGDSSITLNWTGVLFAVLAAAANAYFCIGIGEERTQKMNSIVVSAYVMGICGAFYLVQCLFTGNALLPQNGKGAIFSLLMAIVCGIIPILTLYLGIQKIGVGSAAVISAFEPLFVCIIGVTFLHEILTANMIIGALLIIISIILLQIPMDKIFSKGKTVDS